MTSADETLSPKYEYIHILFLSCLCQDSSFCDMGHMILDAPDLKTVKIILLTSLAWHIKYPSPIGMGGRPRETLDISHMVSQGHKLTSTRQHWVATHVFL